MARRLRASRQPAAGYRTVPLHAVGIPHKDDGEFVDGQTEPVSRPHAFERRPLVGWSLWWRWVAWSVGGYGVALVVFVVVDVVLGLHPAQSPAAPTIAFAVLLAGVVGALQARLLGGHVDWPRQWRWPVLAMVIAGITVLSQQALQLTPDTAPYLMLALVGTAIGGVLQGWFVLRPSLARAAYWPVLRVLIGATITLLIAVAGTLGRPLPVEYGIVLLDLVLAATAMVWTIAGGRDYVAS